MSKHSVYLPPGLWLPGLGQRRRESIVGGTEGLRSLLRFRADRGVIVTTLFTLMFTIYGLRLLDFRIASLSGASQARVVSSTHTGRDSAEQMRSTIADRNGVILAVDVPAPRLIADASQVLYPERTAKALSKIFPTFDEKKIERRLRSRDPYIVLQSVITPAQHSAVLDIGEPGLKIVDRPHRLYPTGSAAAHIIGYLDGNRNGANGVEALIDSVYRSKSEADSTFSPPREQRLTIDIRLQNILQEELAAAQKRFKAKASGALLMDAHTGEILALSSQPSFDPNDLNTLANGAFNHIVSGTYELGSVFKMITIAAALENNVVSLKTKYDVRGVLNVGEFTIEDFVPQVRPLTVSEIFTRSSNIGAVLVAQELGKKRQIEFLSRIGLLSPIRGDFTSVAVPQLPERWGDIELATAAYGHGYAVSPLQFTSAAAALVNGGWSATPTLLMREREELINNRTKVITENTSDQINEILRRNVVSGSGRRARVGGYTLGGKTGTADKVVAGGYSDTQVFNTFFSAFPANNPQYVLFVFLDEPEGTDETRDNRTAGWNVAPTSGAIIRRVGPLLGITPQSEQPGGYALQAMREQAKRHEEQKRIAAALPNLSPKGNQQKILAQEVDQASTPSINGGMNGESKLRLLTVGVRLPTKETREIRADADTGIKTRDDLQQSEIGSSTTGDGSDASTSTSASVSASAAAESKSEVELETGTHQAKIRPTVPMPNIDGLIRITTANVENGFEFPTGSAESPRSHNYSDELPVVGSLAPVGRGDNSESARAMSPIEIISEMDAPMLQMNVAPSIAVIESDLPPLEDSVAAALESPEVISDPDTK